MQRCECALPVADVNTQGDGGLSHALNRLHQRTNTVDRGFINACKSIGRMCDQLHLVPVIKDLACKRYRDVTDSKKVKGRSTEVRERHAASVGLLTQQHLH